NSSPRSGAPTGSGTRTWSTSTSAISGESSATPPRAEPTSAPSAVSATEQGMDDERAHQFRNAPSGGTRAGHGRLRHQRLGRGCAPRPGDFPRSSRDGGTVPGLLRGGPHGGGVPFLDGLVVGGRPGRLPDPVA